MDFVNYDNTDIESNLLADTNSPGLMSAADKDKLDSILNIVNITQKEYDNLETKDPNTLYLIKPPAAILLSGEDFNGYVRNNAADSSVEYGMVFGPDFETEQLIKDATRYRRVNIQDSSSDYKIYMDIYKEIGIIYIHPENEECIIYANENCNDMFKDLNIYKVIIKYIKFINFNTSNVTNMRYMFDATSNYLTSLDLSNWNVSKVTNMSYMFRSLFNLTSLDLSNWNVSNVTSMSYMFLNCSKLSGEIIISNKSARYAGMFANCSTNAGSKFTVNYKSGYQTVAQGMVDTKSSNSNVVLGVQV